MKMSTEMMHGIDIAVGSEGSLPQRYKLAVSTISELSEKPIEMPLTPFQRLTKDKRKRFKLLKHILTPKVPTKKPYFTTTKVRDVSEIKKVPPFSYPADMEQFAHKVLTKAWRSDVHVDISRFKCSQKLNYQQRHKTDVLTRLYVDEPTTDTVEQILKLDPKYFSIIEGRPILQVVNRNDYLDIIRDSLRTKIVIGFREDDIMLIDQKLRYEQMMIDTIKKNYEMYLDTFEEFLSRDHLTAKALLEQAELSDLEAHNAYKDYKVEVKKYGTLCSSLYTVEEKWRNCRAYQKLLFNLSPSWWKKYYMVTHFQSSKGILHDDSYEDEGTIFSKYRKSYIEKGLSLTDILEEFKREVKDNTCPQIYFTEPEQVTDSYSFMEIQNLNAMLHCEELAAPLNNVKNGMKTACKIFDNEIKNLQEIIDKLEGGINWEEQRVTYLEELSTSLIYGEFKKLVKDDNAVNLHVFVEDTYEATIAPNDGNLSVVTMMKAIEQSYRNELLFLDEIPSQQVAQLEDTMFAEEVIVMRLAERAAKQYAELEQLTNCLNRAFAPVYKKPRGKEVKKRSTPLKTSAKLKVRPRVPTEAEVEYLEYFTDFCKLTDDPKDYGVNLDPRQEEASPIGDVIEHRPGSKPDRGMRHIALGMEMEINAHAAARKR